MKSVLLFVLTLEAVLVYQKTVVKAFGVVGKVNQPFPLNSVAEQNFEEHDAGSYLHDEETSLETSSRGFAGFAALAEGTPVEIQVGNLELARKAWKKRRRSGSPLLIPCSILHIDRSTMLIDSIVYLVQKFGNPMKGLHRPNGYRPKDIALSIGELCTWYRKHLGSSLQTHAADLGFDSPNSMIKALWTRSVRDEQGVEYWKDDADKLWMVARMSRLHGHRLASRRVLLQFEHNSDDDDADDGSPGNNKAVVRHTGYTRFRRPPPHREGFPYQHARLSAALRVSQRAVDTGVVTEGSIMTAVIASYDKTGDAGAPLLRLAMAPTKTSRKEKDRKTKPARRVAHRGRSQKLVDVVHKLEELKAGDGPFTGTVVRVSSKSEFVLVDFGLGRTIKTAAGDTGVERVLGVLPFSDVQDKRERNPLLQAQDKRFATDRKANLVNTMQYIEDVAPDNHHEEQPPQQLVEYPSVEDFFTEEDLRAFGALDPDETMEDFYKDDEEYEEIAHLLRFDKDGNLLYEDPKTGESFDISDLDDINDIKFAGAVDEDVVDNHDDDENDIFAGLTSEERFEKLDEIMSISEPDDEKEENQEPVATNFDEDVGATTTRKLDPMKMKAGDDITVYCQAVSKQSSRCMLTLHENVKPMKDVKKAAGVTKKLERLVEQLGGDIQAILDLKGTECGGVVKATSRTGDWFYVQPERHDLPVGVAQLAEGLAADSLGKGDSVTVRLEGVDETRGQLAMTVTGKAP